jgi:4'-phosphopantetheinyl transferase
VGAEWDRRRLPGATYSRRSMVAISSPRCPGVERVQGWSQGPAAPALSRGALHVWRADLESVEDELGDCLSEQEQDRARRIEGQRERRRWRRSRGLLRTVLSLYLEQPPSELLFVTRHRGKPALSGAGRQLFFSLSHSRRFALLAISRDGEVGADLEVLRDVGADVVALAERAFGSIDARHVEQLDRASRSRAFLCAWTRREAELKLRGSGLGGTRETRGGRPWIHELELGSGLLGAIAYERSASELCCWEWPPGGIKALRQ